MLGFKDDLPLKIYEKDLDRKKVEIRDSRGADIATVHWDGGEAEQIVHACNCFPHLLAALKSASEVLGVAMRCSAQSTGEEAEINATWAVIDRTIEMAEGSNAYE